jgi:hypothetical protein
MYFAFDSVGLLILKDGKGELGVTVVTPEK